MSTESMQTAYLVMKRTNIMIKSLVETKDVDLMRVTVVMKMKKNTQTIIEINHMREIQSTKNSGQVNTPPDSQITIHQTESEEDTPVECAIKPHIGHYSSASNSKGT